MPFSYHLVYQKLKKPSVAFLKGKIFSLVMVALSRCREEKHLESYSTIDGLRSDHWQRKNVGEKLPREVRTFLSISRGVRGAKDSQRETA